MTSMKQTHPRYSADGRRRTPAAPGGPDTSGKGRARPALPAVDASTAFGCVDWFLYPEQAAGRSSAEAQAKRA